jgi:hypothetical protein
LDHALCLVALVVTCGDQFVLHLLFLDACLKVSEALLSNVCFLSPRPANLILLIIFSHARIISSFDLLCIGLTNMYFALSWIATMIYMLPHWEVNGNAPIWLV